MIHQNYQLAYCVITYILALAHHDKAFRNERLTSELILRLYANFGSLLRNHFVSPLLDPTDRYLKAWKPVPSCPQFDQQRVLSRFFSLLLPLPTAAFSTIIAKRKATAEELEARGESNGCREGAYREEDSTRDNGKHSKKIKRNQNLVLDRYGL